MNFSKAKFISIVLIIVAVASSLIWALYMRGENVCDDAKVMSPADSGGKNIDLNSWNIYTNDDYNFLLRYPDTLSVSEFKDSGATVVLIQESGSARGFQIFISAWDEGVESLTAERIERDLPDLVMREVEKVRIGISEGYPAVLFQSENDGIGKTREVWFVYPEQSRGVASNLYQVRAPLSYDTELSWVMSTWTFQSPELTP